MADIRAGAKPKRRAKYGNVATVVDGARFDSKAEARRWQMLKILERAGAISDLQRQVTVPLLVNDKVVRRMRWDFAYIENGTVVYDDTKGAPATEAWRIKADFMAALYPAYELRINGARLT